MAIDKYVEQTFQFECKGRNLKGNEVLANPVKIQVLIYSKQGLNVISSDVYCPYLTGSHSDKCCADDKTTKFGNCAYSFDLPHALKQE